MSPVAAPPSRLADLALAEWTKLRTLRSSVVAVIVTVALTVGIGALVTLAVASSASVATVSDPTAVSLVGVALAQLSMAVSGVLTVTTEYASGTIRVSLMAAPRRHRLLLAKTAVVAAVGVAIGEVVTWSAFGIGQALLHGHVASASTSEPGVTRAVVGAGLYLALIALLGSAIGWMVRSAAAAISLVVGVLFVVPLVLQAVPGRAGTDLQHFWPTTAGSRILDVVRVIEGVPGPWAGLAILAGFVVLALFGAAALLAGRDA